MNDSWKHNNVAAYGYWNREKKLQKQQQHQLASYVWIKYNKKQKITSDDLQPLSIYTRTNLTDTIHSMLY